MSVVNYWRFENMRGMTFHYLNKTFPGDVASHILSFIKQECCVCRVKYTCCKVSLRNYCSDDCYNFILGILLIFLYKKVLFHHVKSVMLRAGMVCASSSTHVTFAMSNVGSTRLLRCIQAFCIVASNRNRCICHNGAQLV